MGTLGGRRAGAVGALLACVIAGAAASASVADAAPRSPVARFATGSPAVAAAQTMAVARWGWSPCAGKVTIRWKRQAVGINAMSLWSTLGPDAYGDPADNQDCEIELNPAATWTWPKLCTVIIHEYGHLTGHDHDATPGRLMSAIYTTPAPECAVTNEPGVAASRRLGSGYAD